MLFIVGLDLEKPKIIKKNNKSLAPKCPLKESFQGMYLCLDLVLLPLVHQASMHMERPVHWYLLLLMDNEVLSNT